MAVGIVGGICTALDMAMSSAICIPKPESETSAIRSRLRLHLGDTCMTFAMKRMYLGTNKLRECDCDRGEGGKKALKNADIN